MTLWNSVSGAIRVRITSANVNNALQAVNDAGITVSKVTQKDELTVEFQIQRRKLRELNNIIQRRGEKLELTRHEGMYWGVRRLFRRPILVAGCLLLFVLTLYLPTKVLFISVEGNENIPTRAITEAAEECGIRFGTTARIVRSEKMKNALLQKLPDLQWAGINTNGCVAVICVREKTTQDKKEPDYPISSLVAIRDGYITDITVTAGSAACKPGQTVKEGQVLVSAYTDCGLHIQAQKAKGEVFANTQRELVVKTPSQKHSKTKLLETKQNFSIIIGKKQINLSKGSGISGGECDRIKSVNYLTLPGGFQLPVALVRESVITYTTETTISKEPEIKQFLSSYASIYLSREMVAGRIDSREEKLVLSQQFYTLTGQYQCNEMICKTRVEEILHHNE